ncbi:MAG: rhomboid family intramembrane serine protease [Rubrivivax sp.]|nr:MAG: rhomboid family intramembrane serine protease [Rubrivivax sp.]
MLGLPALASLWPGFSALSNWPLHPSAAWPHDPVSLWTCAWVHANTPHLVANLLGLGLIMGLGWVLRLSTANALAWFLAWPLTHLALLLDPRLDTYFGLSGVLHAAVGIVAVSLITRPGPAARRPRLQGWLVLATLFAKCWFENPELRALVPHPALSMTAAPLSHLAGTVVGTLTALLVAAVSTPFLRWRRCSKSRP